MTTFVGQKWLDHADHADPQPGRLASRRAGGPSVGAPHRSESASPPSEDAALVAGIRTGDEDAFDQTFRQYATPLMLYARRIVSSGAVAQDVVMDVFMRLWRDRVALPEGLRLAAYLRASVRNSCINYLRHDKVKTALEMSGAASDWSPAMSAAPLMPDEDLERREVKEIVRRALAALTPRMRLALEMRWLDEKSYKEIANALGMQVRSVEVSVGRAMRILRERMREGGDAE